MKNIFFILWKNLLQLLVADFFFLFWFLFLDICRSWRDTPAILLAPLAFLDLSALIFLCLNFVLITFSQTGETTFWIITMMAPNGRKMFI